MPFQRETFIENLNFFGEGGKTVYYGNVPLEIKKEYADEDGNTYSFEDYINLLMEIKLLYEQQMKLRGFEKSTIFRNLPTVLFQEFLMRFICRVSVKKDYKKFQNLHKAGFSPQEFTNETFDRVSFPSLGSVVSTIENIDPNVFDFVKSFLEQWQTGGQTSSGTNNKLSENFIKNFSSMTREIRNFMSAYGSSSDLLPTFEPHTKGYTSEKSLKNATMGFMFLRDKVFLPTLKEFLRFWDASNYGKQFTLLERYYSTLFLYNVFSLYFFSLVSLKEKLRNVVVREPQKPMSGPPGEYDFEVQKDKWKNFIGNNGFFQNKERDILLFLLGHLDNTVASVRISGKQTSPQKRVPSLQLETVKNTFFTKDDFEDVVEFQRCSEIMKSFDLKEMSRLGFLFLGKNLDLKAIQVQKTTVGREHVKKNENSKAFIKEDFTRIENWLALFTQVLLEDPMMPPNFLHVAKKSAMQAIVQENIEQSLSLWTKTVAVRSFLDFVFFKLSSGETNLEKIKSDFILLNVFTFISKDTNTSPIVVRPLLPVSGVLVEDTGGVRIETTAPNSLIDIFLVSKKEEQNAPNYNENEFALRLREAIKEAQKNLGSEKSTVKVIFMDREGNSKEIEVYTHDSVFLTSMKKTNTGAKDYRSSAHADIFIQKADDDRFYISMKKSNFSYWSGVNLERLGGLSGVRREERSPYFKQRFTGKLKHQDIYSKSNVDFVDDIKNFGNLLTSLVEVFSQHSLLDEKLITQSEVEKIKDFLLMALKGDRKILETIADQKGQENIVLINTAFYSFLQKFIHEKNTQGAKQGAITSKEFEFERDTLNFLKHIVSSFVQFLNRQAVEMRYDINNVLSKVIENENAEINFSFLFWSFIYNKELVLKALFGEERETEFSKKSAENVHCIIVGDVTISAVDAGVVSVSPVEGSYIILSDVAHKNAKNSSQPDTLNSYEDFFSKFLPILHARKAQGKKSFNLQDFYVYVAPLFSLASGNENIESIIQRNSKNFSGNVFDFLFTAPSGVEEEEGISLIDYADSHYGRAISPDDFKKGLKSISNQLNSLFSFLTDKNYANAKKQGKDLRLFFRLEEPGDIAHMKKFLKKNITKEWQDLLDFVVQFRFSVPNVPLGHAYAQSLMDIVIGQVPGVCRVRLKEADKEHSDSSGKGQVGLQESKNELKKIRRLKKRLEEALLLPRKDVPEQHTWWREPQKEQIEFIKEFSQYLSQKENMANFFSEVVNVEGSIEQIKENTRKNTKLLIHYLNWKLNSEMGKFLPKEYMFEIVLDENNFSFDDKKIQQILFIWVKNVFASMAK
ncbi:MAG: hypothetical protein N3A54_01515 [Patescibacteria group bacterium]|nr:hypothetical protein [Patescibacteria group bacterium]